MPTASASACRLAERHADAGSRRNADVTDYQDNAANQVLVSVGYAFLDDDTLGAVVSRSTGRAWARQLFTPSRACPPSSCLRHPACWRSSARDRGGLGSRCLAGCCRSAASPRERLLRPRPWAAGRSEQTRSILACSFRYSSALRTYQRSSGSLRRVWCTDRRASEAKTRMDRAVSAAATVCAA